ncbi:hypothetical protein CDD83_10763 [Cordyceps sp. RAO-2017]|nr:hypothetical protein CDD83_10763 [Cordyceps sp. RAO-2017]
MAAQQGVERDGEPKEASKEPSWNESLPPRGSRRARYEVAGANHRVCHRVSRQSPRPRRRRAGASWWVPNGQGLHHVPTHTNDDASKADETTSQQLLRMPPPAARGSVSDDDGATESTRGRKPTPEGAPDGDSRVDGGGEHRRARLLRGHRRRRDRDGLRVWPAAEPARKASSVTAAGAGTGGACSIQQRRTVTADKGTREERARRVVERQRESASRPRPRTAPVVVEADEDERRKSRKKEMETADQRYVGSAATRPVADTPGDGCSCPWLVGYPRISLWMQQP